MKLTDGLLWTSQERGGPQNMKVYFMNSEETLGLTEYTVES